VRNLWLAAHAEDLGVGRVSHSNDRPESEKAGWLPRLLYYEQWGETDRQQAVPGATLAGMQAANCRPDAQTA